MGGGRPAIVVVVQRIRGMTTVTIRRDNLLQALLVAIDAQRLYERDRLKFSSDSAFVAGLDAVADAIRAGARVEVVE